MSRRAAPPLFRYDPETDRPREECGVFGVFGHEEAAVIAALGLHALQHRGQEGCGVATFDGEDIHTERHLGLIGDHFAGPGLARRLPGFAAIGHTRYSTQGGTILRNVQPLYAELATGGFAIGHNGNLTNSMVLKADLVRDGAIFQSTSDTEVILQLMARSRRRTLVDRFLDALQQIEGAYALVGLAENMLLGARDPLGIRPLVLGDLGGAPILASETCALDTIGARYVRDIEPGEVAVIARDGAGVVKVRSLRIGPPQEPRPCLFEYVYFARPDSIIDGRSVYSVRKRFGERLAQEAPADADIVVPVPDSGVPAAMGFAAASGLPYELGIVRNQYVGRTFIQPKQAIRSFKVRMKHNVNRDVIAGKRVTLIDDSIVRGTTSEQIVRMVREAGAAEVHFRVACPPIRFPDFYGIDMPSRDDLIAANRTIPQIARKLGADSVGFLSVEGMYWALGQVRNAEQPQYADHCFTGDYPTRLEDLLET